MKSSNQREATPISFEYIFLNANPGFDSELLVILC
jgi:hypothetical protein